MNRAIILVADRQPRAWPEYEAALSLRPDFAVQFAQDLPSALSQLHPDGRPNTATDVVGVPSAILLADREGEPTTLDYLNALRTKATGTPIAIISAHPTVELVRGALAAGATEWISEPASPPELLKFVDRLPANTAAGQSAISRSQAQLPLSGVDFVGGSSKMSKVFETIQQVAKANVDVLIWGETGTGKEVAARAIHAASGRAGQPFIAVDCGAIPENLMESEFFGHEKGAFTGAENRRVGLLELAAGGTFFLDEVGELPLLLQAKLLRTLQERKLRRVGGRDEIAIDVRVIAATARNLDVMISEKQFREDLYYRINVVRIDLPPLRLRGDDLGLLVEHFCQRYSREIGKQVVGISPEAYHVLAHYRWPGNVRELQNVIRRGIALTPRPYITVDDLPDELVTSATLASEKSSDQGSQGFFAQRDLCVARFERDYLRSVLLKHKGNVKAAAEEAELPRGTLYRLLKNHGIESTEFR